MPQTTSQVNACDARIYLDNGAGLLVEISGSSNEASMDFTNQLGELYTFGPRFPVRGECKSDATINLNVIYSLDDGEAMNILRDWFYTTRGQKTLRIDVPDDDPGSDRYQFEVFLESLNIPLVSNDANPILVSCVLRPTGTFTSTTIGS
jgi:hypothetical protein